MTSLVQSAIKLPLKTCYSKQNRKKSMDLSFYKDFGDALKRRKLSEDIQSSYPNSIWQVIIQMSDMVFTWALPLQLGSLSKDNGNDNDDAIKQ